MGRVARPAIGCAFASALFVLFAAGAATAAPRILLGPVYGEGDISDESGAFGLLVLTALDNGQGIAGVVPAGAGKVTLDRASEVLGNSGAEILVIAEVDRLGPMLIATAQVVDRNGKIIGKFAGTASDGAVAELAGNVVKELGPALGLTPPWPPELSVGQLRPFARAEQLRGLGRADDAARALAGADPVVALRLPPAAATMRWIWNNAKDPDARLIAIGVGATPREVSELTASNRSDAARSLRALTQVGLSDANAAAGEIRGLDGPTTALARAAIAQLRQDRTARDAAITELVADPKAVERRGLAWLGKLAPGVLPPALEAAVLEAGAQSQEPRLAAVIGLRAVEANVEIERALALVTVNELDRGERARLKQVLPKLTGPDAIRLTAEQALADGDFATAKAQLGKLKRATDQRSALYRGRIAWALGDLDTAAVELGTAKAGPERARVLLAKGDVKAASIAMGDVPTSRLAKVAKAELAAADGKHADAVKLLREAEELAPGDRDVQHRLAGALELSGDKAGAALVRTRSAELAMMPMPPKLEGDAGSAAIDSGSAAPVAAGPKPSAAEARMRTELRDLLRQFPPGPLYGRTFVVAPIGEAPSAWALREIDAAPMVAQLGAALEEPPIGSRVIGRVADRYPSKPTATALSDLATRNGAQCALLYDVDIEGALRLVLFDATTGEALEARGTIDVDAMGMVSWNLRWLSIPLGILGVFALIGILLVVRGSGVIEVRVKLDPSGSNEVLCLEVQKTSRRWLIREPESFRAKTRDEGAKVMRRTARLIGPVTKFKVPPGHWWVHCYGVYDRPGSIRLLDDTNTSEVDVGRGGHEVTTIDLVPIHAELRVTVMDENPRGVTMWIDELAQRYYTDGKGEAVILCPVGDHTLHIDARGLRLSRQIAFATPTVEFVEINLARERMLGEVSGGKSLRKRAVSDQSISFRSSMAGFDPEAGERAKLAAEAQAALQLEAHAKAAGDGGASAGGVAAAAGGGGGKAQTMARVSSSPTGAPAMSRSGVGPTAPMPMSGSRPAIKSEPGLLAGRYRIVKTLGKGAMGVVYRAHDENLEREVAVKVLASELRQHPEALRFFVEEAKALAQLNHPNIVSVYDQTSDGTDTYLIMEFVDGRTLESLLEEKQKLPPHTALALIDQLCAGLSYVHARRVIHRDIKPANIFVSRERVVKLGDFGLARVMRELSIRKTEIRGTPLYMAPEQITGENVTNRADIYAVGCTLFELLTGRPPFTDGEILYHHIHTKPPKPSDFEKNLSKELDDLVMDCIKKDAKNRVESAQAIRDRIRGLNPTQTIR